MYDLTKFTLREMTECGAALRRAGSEAENMEEVANSIVRYLYDHLLDKQTGEKACALVRLFKTHACEGLEADLQEFARGVLSGHSISSDIKCLTLLATAGEKSAWNSRKTSVGYKAIPLPSEQVVEQFPMVSQLVKQLGLEVNTVLDPDPSLLVDLEQRSFNVFHVPEAVGSPYVVAQEEFVIPVGIKSVLGFGGMLPSGNLFAIIMFSKVPIARQTADMFKTLALNVKMAVLPFVGGPIFA
jgi:hypothetical protein